VCGIIGIVSEQPFTSHEVLSRLKKLEYRGYDSWGYWNGKTLTKKTGKIDVIEDHTPVKLAISHTRWATHGGVTEWNAHPHRVGNVTIVHNGIIENYAELRDELKRHGATFSSETDSEVIAHLVYNRLLQKNAMKTILQELLSLLKGTFATLLMVDGDDKLYAAKRDSPLALGICPDRMILASDIYAFNDATDQAIFFENDEYAILTPTLYEFFGEDGRKLEKTPKQFTWASVAESKESYAHYMRKEMDEEPAACQRLITSLTAEQQPGFEKLISLIRSSKKTVFTAAGTAYHASLLGASFLHQQGINAQAIIASEFENFITIEPGTLVIAVSQSGETMDVIEALKYSRDKGATIASIVNVPYSTIERMSSLSLQILAGPEIAVASTKAFTNQATMMLAIAQAFGLKNGIDTLPKKLALTLALEPKIEKLAKALHHHRDLYVLGRKLGYPVSREIALKIKEISYIHAEGMMGGELKHGTIALIEQGTPVVSLIYDNDPKMRSSTQEVKARGAHAVVIGTMKEDEFHVPAESEAEFAILAATVGQLFAYHLAKERGCPIDKPRNLAKSVTVS